ncbi:unnamed protein product [Lactuca saligna]|uniref:Integrase catalytic domain-containing protein n=1 Tax=Lactuca saligna TaxID=75948 RepID=A0AA35ZTN7_LACSI|nr:unnamed protein product [Lactuca saligna]
MLQSLYQSLASNLPLMAQSTNYGVAFFGYLQRNRRFRFRFSPNEAGTRLCSSLVCRNFGVQSHCLQQLPTSTNSHWSITRELFFPAPRIVAGPTATWLNYNFQPNRPNATFIWRYFIWTSPMFKPSAPYYTSYSTSQVGSFFNYSQITPHVQSGLQQQHNNFFGGSVPANQPAHQFTHLSFIFQAMSVQPPPDNNCYMDTGANSHMSFNQVQTDIKAFQYDNGREFNNQPLLQLFQTNGIQVRFCPYTSQQNGKLERSIHTINNIVRTSLFQASLSIKFCVEALLTVVHTLNLHPTTTLSFKTPFETLFGLFPNYDHLHVFGCLCYPNTSSTASHKLAPCSSACVYLGSSPDHKGYRCLDLITQHIIIYRHVVFYEDHFPYTNFQPSPSTSYYELLVPNDDIPLILSPSNPSPLVPPVDTSSPSNSSSFVPSPHVQPSAPSSNNHGHPMITRSRTGSLKPRYLLNLSASSISPIPRSTYQALCDLNWKSAMVSEMEALQSNHTWDLVSPLLMQILLVVDGYIDTSLTLKAILINIKRFTVYITSVGFQSSRSDTSLFTYHHENDVAYLLLYVDNIILTASLSTLATRVISRLSAEFPMSDLGPLSFFLVIAATRSS